MWWSVVSEQQGVGGSHSFVSTECIESKTHPESVLFPLNSPSHVSAGERIRSDTVELFVHCSGRRCQNSQCISSSAYRVLHFISVLRFSSQASGSGFSPPEKTNERTPHNTVRGQTNGGGACRLFIDR